MNYWKNVENKVRNLEQLKNEIRVQAYTDGYRAGYLEACRWNDIGTGCHDGPLSTDDANEEWGNF